MTLGKWIGLTLFAAALGAVYFLSAPPSPARGPDRVAEVKEPDAIALPPDFQKLLEKEKEIRAQPEPAESERGLKLGAPIPELKGDWLSANGGAPELKNKVLLLDFFTTVCGSCVASIPDNNALYEKYRSQGFVFAFVSPEPKTIVEEFTAQFPKKINYPVLVNAEPLFQFCEIREMPATLLFDRSGVLRWKGSLLEKDGKLDETFEKALLEALKP